MSRPHPNIDRRLQRTGREARQGALERSRADRQAAADRLRALVPGVRIDFDETLGSPQFIASTRGFLATADGRSGAVSAVRLAEFSADDPQRVVKAFIDEHGALFGHGSAVLGDAKLVRDYETAHNGMHTYVWQQQLDGVRVFESTFLAHVTKSGDLVNVASRLVPDPAAAAPNRAAVLAAPRVDVKTAISAAGASVGEVVPPAQIAGNAQPEGFARKQQFRSTRLLDVSAEYVWLPEDEASLRLCWEVIFTSKSRGEMFRALVDTDTGEVIVRQGLTEYISNASYRVFTSDSPTPMSPGLATPGTTQPAEVARALVTLDALDTTASPNGWIDDGVNETRGNNVDAHLDLNADNVADTPRPQGSPSRVFDFALDLTQAPGAYRDAAVTNLFYWNNLIHDRYYQLGFTEAAGNFQNNNFGKGGSGNDAVQADAQDGSGTNNANFSTPPDGSPGRMQMYVFTGPTPDRDGDFDQEIVIHEYTHGLSNRLVGGGAGISALQPRGMGEGWSDFYGLCLLSQPSDDPNGVYASGAYASYQLSGHTQNYYYGIRRYPYCTDLAKNPLTFKDIDPAQASTHTGVPRSPIIGTTANEVHNMGEVWCVTLWDARANLIAKHGAAVGNNLILQLLTDGMKLAPVNPNFLQARDAIFQADLVDNAGANQTELWAAFAKRGMGSSATSPAGSTTTGLVEAYDFPDNLSVTPTAAFGSSGEVGGPFTPAAKTYTLSNTGTASLSWTASNAQPWLTLSMTSGTLAPGATTTVTATLNAVANSLAAGTYSDTVTFHNNASGANLTRPVSLSVSPPRVYYFALDTDPGWTRTGEWAFGQPAGGGGTSYGFHDPTSGATGTKVLGVNLAGDYSLAIGGPYYVTTTALNLSGYTGTKLQFQRWLNTDYQSYAYATIEISTNGTSWTQIWNNGTSTIADSSWTKVQYNISSIADNQSTVYVRWGYQIGSGAFPYSGWNIDDIEILGTVPNSVTVTLPANVTEGDAPATGTVTASPAPTSNLVVSLTSSDSSRLNVPASITIAAGTTSATFSAAVIDDTLLNGTNSVAVTPAAVGWASRAATVSVQDNEVAALTVSLPSSAAEGVGSVSGTVSVSAPPASSITVQLSSNMPNDAAPPAAVTIPAGQTSVGFSLAIIDDTRIDGPQVTTITASVASWTAGSANVVVADNENTNLVVNLPAATREGNGTVVGTVQISGTLASALTVALSSSDMTELTVPASVTIAAGQISASFNSTAVDDAIADGTQSATVTASTGGFTDGIDTINVQDNDADHFVIGAIGTAQIPNVPFAVSVSARDVNNVVITNYNSPVALSASALPVSPATMTGWVNGVWSGNVSVGGAGTDVVLTADDGQGHTGTSNAFSLAIGPLHHFGWSAIASPQTRDNYFPVTIAAQDAGNNTVTSFNGTTSLKTAASSGVQILSWVGYADTTSAGEYQNTKTAISTYFPGYTETSTTVTDATQLASALAGKQVFLIPEQENAGTGVMGTLGTAWASVLTSFVNSGGVVIVCSWQYDEHLVLVNSGLMTATKGSAPSSGSVTKTADTALNAGVATPFTASYISVYSGSNGTVSLQTTGGSPVVLSRAVGSGLAVLIGTDFYTLGTGMDRIVANAVALASSTSVGVPILPPTSGSFVNGVWSGNVAIPFAGSGVKLRTDDGAGHTGDSNSFTVQAPAAPGGSGGAVFSEPFEDTTLGSWWTITGTSTYRTQLTAANSPHGGTKHLTMDSSADGSYARNEATLTVNLAGRNGVMLSFWAKGFTDEPNGPPPSPFSGGFDFDGVAISADGTNWYEVQALRTLTTSYAQFTVNLDAAIAARELSYNSDFKIRFNQYDNFTIPTDGIAIDDILITANALPSIAVTVPAQANENAGMLTGTVALPSALGSDTTVALASNATAKVSVPASITVPAGQLSAAFPIAVLDNTLLDGNRDVVVTATAPGGGIGSGSILIVDNEVTTLTLTMPASTTEGATGVTATATLGVAPSGPIAFNVVSSDTTEITVPTTVSFTPGQTSISIPLTVVNDTLIDGAQNATVTLSATGWTSASKTIAVLDNETTILSLSSVTTVSEGSSIGATISISGTLTTSLVINLSSSSSAQLSVPATATIPAGSTSVTVSFVGVDDALTDGTQNVTVSASASGFTSAVRTISVLDNDVHHFTFGTITGPKSVGVPFSATLTAQDLNNVTITSFFGPVTFTAAGDGGPVVITATGTFSSGVWSGSVTCNSSGTNVRLTAAAAAASGLSNSFNVVVPPTISLTPPSVALTLAEKETTTRTVAIGNSGSSALTWSIASSSFADVVSVGPVVDGHEPVGKSEPLRWDPVSVYEGARGAEAPIESATMPLLSTVLANLNANNAAVRSAIPNRYAFSEGVAGTSISDGGGDMYDGGNYLGTNLGSYLSYSDGVIAASALLGTGGQYFTRKYDGLWVFAADVNGLGYFDITGNLGADSGGATDSVVLSVVREGVAYRGFVKRVYNAGDPSVNHLIIVADNGSVTHSVATDTNDDYHRLTSLTGITRIYHVLYAGTGGAYIDNTATLGIMSTFLDAIYAPDFAIPSPASGTVAAGGAQNLTLTINAGSLAPGTYSQTFLLNSNDPIRPQVSLPVTLTVVQGGKLTVTPDTALAAGGPFGGPFTPSVQSYTLTNTGGSPLNWTAMKIAPWLELSNSSGTLAAGASVVVTATIVASVVEPGSYDDTIYFANLTNHIGDTGRAASLVVTLPAPVLAPEPTVTPATSNTISWNAIVGADAYEAEIATDVAFAAPVSSGWVATTNHTFSGLADSTQYYYRVRARRSVPDQTSLWSQTTQLEFDDGTTSDVVANTSGNVTLAPGTGSPIFGRPANGSFEEGVVNGGPITGWAVDGTTSMGAMEVDYLIPPMPTLGTRFLLTFTHLQTAHVPGDFSRAAQNVDFSGAQTMMFDAMLRSSGDWSGSIVGEVRIDGTTVWSRAAQGSYQDQAVDVSSYTGVHTLEFRTAVTVAGTYDSQWVMWDDVRLITPGNTYSSSGTLTSPAIAPAPWLRWGALDLTKDVSAVGTALTVDVLDAAGTLLAANVASGTDLNDLPAVASQPVIRLRANLSTTNTANTPRLDDWSVGYVTELQRTFISEWSDVETSFQFNEPPKLSAIDDQVILEDGASDLVTLIFGDDAATLDGLGLIVLVSNPALLPAGAIEVNGPGAIRLMQITPPENVNGVGRVTFRLIDEGGKTTEQVFGVFVMPVNDPPGFMKGADQNVVEDAGPQVVRGWASAIHAGASNEVGQALDFIVSNDNSEIFAAAPGIASDGTLTFTPAMNAVGRAEVTVRLHDNGGTAYGGIDTSVPQTFIITVGGVNDPPSFVKGADQTLLEDAGPQTVPAWATQLSPGAPDETAQTLDFIVESDNDALFAAGPALAPDGTLSFTAAPDANGTAMVSVRLHDSGGGADTSTPQTFAIHVTPVNDPPAFTKGGNQQIKQNAGAQSIAAWATNVSCGPANEVAQNLTFVVTSDRPDFFAAEPAVTPDGTLTFTPAPGTSGMAAVTVLLRDDGGTDHGGSDTSATQTFTIFTSSVNDAPSYVMGPDLETAQDAGRQAFPGWASEISPGPEDEVGQVLDFRVSVDDATLFTTPPAITPDGTLTYTPAPKASGKATVTVQLHDNGGTEDGGNDTSAPQTFVIAITTYREEAGTYNGLVRASDGTPPSAARSGLARVTIAANGVFTGRLVMGGRVTSFKGRLDHSGVAHFGGRAATTVALAPRDEYALSASFRVDVAGGSDRLEGAVHESSSPIATFTADRAAYSAGRSASRPWRGVPMNLQGVYTAIFGEPTSEGLAPAEYPHGSGAGMIRVKPGGSVRFIGTLADGRKLSYANSLSKTGEWPLYHGDADGYAITGPVSFRDTPSVSDLDGLGMWWFRAEESGGLYPAGWPSGIHTDLFGARYVPPPRAVPIIAFPAVAADSANADLTLLGTSFAAAIAQPLHVGANHRVRPLWANDPNMAMKLSARTGLFNGKFTHPRTGNAANFGGAILQKQARGFGAFRTEAEVGSVDFVPR